MRKVSVATLLRFAAIMLIALTSVGFARDGVSLNQHRAPNVVYFPQTEHNLSGDFLDYWHRHGGVMVFGYPISEKLEENGRTVQYFERTVFEWHPEDDWPVQQRLLGAREAESLSDRSPLRPVPPDESDHCDYVEATSHRLCAGFREYWNEHGGVAVFGYPLSEEMNRDGLTVQIFERAVLEWHADRQKILIDLLGIEAAEHNGVDRTPVDRHPGAPDYKPELLVPPPDLDDLEVRLRDLVNGWSGQHAVSITDLQTGETISINGDRRQLAACTIKIPIMVAVAQDIAEGKYTRDEVEHLVIPAMGPSLTPPARELLRIIGDGDIGAGVHRSNNIMRELGATESLLTHPPGYYWEEYGYLASHGEAENWLTTNDLNRMLASLWQGKLLPDETSEYFWWSLTIATPFLDGAFAAGFPAGTPMYHKIGVLYEPMNTWNDSGIVVATRDGQSYAYAVSYLSSANPGSYRAGYYNNQVISELAWETFGE